MDGARKQVENITTPHQSRSLSKSFHRQLEGAGLGLGLAVSACGAVGAQRFRLGGNGESSIVLGEIWIGPTHWVYTNWRIVSINPPGSHHASGMFEHGLLAFIICACMLSTADSLSSKMVTVGREAVNARNTGTRKSILFSYCKKNMNHSG